MWRLESVGYVTSVHGWGECGASAESVCGHTFKILENSCLPFCRVILPKTTQFYQLSFYSRSHTLFSRMIYWLNEGFIAGVGRTGM